MAAAAGAGDAPREVVLLKRAGVTAYEEVSEEFGDRCRVRARVVSFGDEGTGGVRERISRGDLVVTVGQEALDAVVGAGARVIPTLAFHTPRGLVGPPAAPSDKIGVASFDTIVGLMLDSGRLPGAMALASAPIRPK